MRAEGFSCSLDVLYGGLGEANNNFDTKKIKNFSCIFVFSFIKTLDPDPYPDLNSLEMLDPDPFIRIRINLKFWIRIRIFVHCFFLLAGPFPRNLTVRPRSYTPDLKYLKGATPAAVNVISDPTFQLSGSGYSGIRFRIQHRIRLQNFVIYINDSRLNVLI